MDADGSNAPIWNRKHPQGHYFVIRSQLDNTPGKDEVLTDKRYHSWVHSALKDGKAVIYHANTIGKGKLFLYTLKDEKTAQLSNNDEIDFRYPHAEDTPK
jgi:hypothetical protein